MPGTVSRNSAIELHTHPRCYRLFWRSACHLFNPRFQHYFWKRQKREELRRAIVAEVNRLAAEFQSNYLFKGHVENTPERALTYASEGFRRALNDDLYPL